MSCILATAAKTSPAALNESSGNMNPLSKALIILDFIFLLYVVFSPENRFKEYTRFLLLVHGSAPILFYGAEMIAPGNFYLIIGIFFALVVLYYFLCQIDLFVQIITIVNCCLLVGVVISSLLKETSYSIMGSIGGPVIAAAIFIFLGITRFDTLYKIHTIFVCYIVTTILIEALTNVQVFSNAGNDVKTSSLSFLIAATVFGILTFLLFFK